MRSSSLIVLSVTVSVSLVCAAGCSDDGRPGGASDTSIARMDASVVTADAGLCGPGTTACAERCVDLQLDPASCGACGKACAAGEVCSSGACALTCVGGTTRCGDLCVDTQSDVNNCGGCSPVPADAGADASVDAGKSTRCSAGQVCSAGQCATACGTGLVDCAGACIDPKSSPSHCGATAGCGQGGKGSAGAACVGDNACDNGACHKLMTWTSAPFLPVAIPGAGLSAGDMDLDANGDAVLASNPARALVRVNRYTGAVSTIATGIGSAESLLGVAYRAADGLFYVSDTAGAIRSVANDGTVSSTITTITGTTITGLAIAPASFGAYGGRLIASTIRGDVVAITVPGGGQTTIVTGPPPVGNAVSPSGISDLAFAPDGTLYVVGLETVRTVSPAGVVTAFVGGLSLGDGITVDPTNTRLYVADSGTDSVVEVVIATKAKTSLGSYDIDSGWFVGGIRHTGSTLLVMTGESDLTLRKVTLP